MTVSPHTVRLPARRRLPCVSATLLACVAAMAGLTACGRSVPTTATVESETRAPMEAVVSVHNASGVTTRTLTPIGHSYSVESNELVEVSQLDDGSMKYLLPDRRPPCRSAR